MLVRPLNWRRLIWLLGCWVGGLGVFFLVRAVTQPLGAGDAPIYQAMAEHPQHFTQAPHGYRILIPWLASVLARLTTMSTAQAFLALSASLFAAVVVGLLYWMWQLERLSWRLAMFVALLYAFSYVGAYNAHNFIHVGFGEEFVLLLGFIAIRQRRLGWLLILVLLGQLVKESTAMLIPVWLANEWGSVPTKLIARRLLFLMLAFFTVFVFLRTGLVFHGRTGHGGASHTAIYSSSYFHMLRAYWVSPYNVLMRISETFGLLWPLAVAGFLLTSARDRRLAVMIPFALAQILVATDISRMTATCFPSILFFTAVFLRRLSFSWQVGLAGITVLVFFTYDNNLAFTKWLLLGGYLLVAALWGALRFRPISSGQATCASAF